MSINCVDAVIETANQYDISFMLIASRRQIDSKYFGGGYVNNWNTEAFAEYVKEKDKQNKIILCRDHGGPWQNNKEKNKKLSLDEAMLSAKKSFKSDILAGLKILHIDPSIDIHTKLANIKRSNVIAQITKILFEIGTIRDTNTEELEYTFSQFINSVEKTDTLSIF